jgi:hypothetical protein
VPLARLSSVPSFSSEAMIPVPRKVWLQTSVVMPAALARRRTIFHALMGFSCSPVSSARPPPYSRCLMT